ncbi:hypothetical protein E1B28_008172 [Marasmius oreades]|uniref:Uncharacterized protein n=1 Tax=Marasmius oreades TaxID=181124 RepID=A0A9P7RXZ1_9AGAR|nr:uncharacterized protein E1B28_008172 [Marasmius oreades]KAG7091770.1 hypothetical protein E1B28_008172 [Marasmius oreades]
MAVPTTMSKETRIISSTVRLPIPRDLNNTYTTHDELRRWDVCVGRTVVVVMMNLKQRLRRECLSAVSRCWDTPQILPIRNLEQ